MEGMQTGIQLIEFDEVAIDDYSCPVPEADHSGILQTFINMSSNFA